MSVLLILLVITVFGVFPLAAGKTWIFGLLVCFIGLNFMVGVYSISRKPWHRACGIVLTVAFLIIGLTSVEQRFHNGNIAALVMAMSYFMLLAVIIVYRIFSSGTVNFHRIQGAIAVYILFAIVFAFAYMLIYTINPDSFQFSDRLTTATYRIDFRFIYFSFVTLCTLGYGDISPVSEIAQSVTVIEAIFGILFPAILITRLLSLPMTQRK